VLETLLREKGDNFSLSLLAEVSKLHMPPTGPVVEKDRYSFYVNRTKSASKVWTSDQYNKYLTYIGREFVSFPPRPVNIAGLMTNNVLDRFVFDAALAEVDATSSPGYPFIHLSPLNRGFKDPGLNQEILYFTTCKLLSFLSTCDLRGLSYNEAFLMQNFFFPANVFIKKEPTSVDKIARLIYGTPLNFNIVCRLLFTLFLDESKISFQFCSHKVGMDMYTQEGIAKIVQFYNGMRARNPCGSIVYSDVRGWEYSCKVEMHRAWFEAYALACEKNSRLKPDDFAVFKRVLLNVGYLLEKPFIAFSDGSLMISKDFHVLSGLFITHRYNSDMRAALARLATGFDDYSMTNGDDCDENLPPGWEKDDLVEAYSKVGFIITDVDECTPERFAFSSQEFLVNELRRIPLSLTKAVANYSLSTMVEAKQAIRWFVSGHPRWDLCRQCFDDIDVRFTLRD